MTKSPQQRFNSIFQEVLARVKPTKNELKEISDSLAKFLDKAEKNRKKLGFEAQIFIGGSFAKKTLIKKGKYDVDVFVRFDKQYSDAKISDLTQKILKGFKFERIHGSRDYFKIKASENLFFEIVPVRKVRKPSEAVNITDLSYYHVGYVKKKLKDQKILDDVLLAKAFCDAAKVYGAESYIHGFSGYGLELLIYHYKGFLNLVRGISKSKGRIVIDIEKFHKNKNSILLDLNSAKLESPIVLIDPTHKQRNVLAALSNKTFDKFRGVCKAFLRSPSLKFFERKSINRKAWQLSAEKKHCEFLEMQVRTSKQSGDIAGSKLLKFFGLIQREITRYFQISNSEFEYTGGKSAAYFFITKPKKELLLGGPCVEDVKHVKRFKKKYKKVFSKKGRFYAVQKLDFDLKKFLKEWQKKNQKIMREMSIDNIEITN